MPTVPIDALAFHDMTDTIPSRIWVAIGSKDRKLDLPFFSGELFSLVVPSFGTPSRRPLERSSVLCLPIRWKNKIADLVANRLLGGIPQHSLGTGVPCQNGPVDGGAQYRFLLR